MERLKSWCGRARGFLPAITGAVILAVVLAIALGAGSGASAQRTQKQPKEKVRIAILVANGAGLGLDVSLGARISTRNVATRLEKLGFQFIAVDDKGQCTLSATGEILQGKSTKAALACAGDFTRQADLALFYYAGAVALGVGGPAVDVGDKAETIAVRAILQEEAARTNLTTVVLVDGLRFNGARDANAEPPKRGARRILALSWPEREQTEPSTRKSDFSRRLNDELDAEIEARANGAELRDLREFFTAPGLLAIEGEQRIRHVSLEGIEGRRLTLMGAQEQESAPAAAKFDCTAALREGAASPSCPRISRLAAMCAAGKYAPYIDTLQQLRCNEDFVNRKGELLKTAFEATRKKNTCAAYEEFVKKYAEDYDLAEAPDMEKGVRLRNSVCEDERRQKEVALLESALTEAVAVPDCDTLSQFQRTHGQKLTSEQSGRLEAASKARCELEKTSKSELTSCLANAENRGDFCGGSKCFETFKAKLPRDKYIKEFLPEPTRQANICRDFTAMRSCFSNDPCGGERCSHPLRLTVAQGNFFSHIETHEREAVRQCNAAKDRERLDRERVARAERDKNTFFLRLCNTSRYDTIYAAASYYDYDAREWIIHGWWKILKGSCANVGGGLKRGDYYVYAHVEGQRLHWAGEKPLCVSNDVFRRPVRGGETCTSNLLKKFIAKWATDSTEVVNFGS